MFHPIRFAILNAMNAKKRKKIYRVCVVLDRSIKANRDKHSGILRYASEVGDWEIRALNFTTPGFDARCDTLFSAWSPDGIIGSTMLETTFSNLRRTQPRARPEKVQLEGFTRKGAKHSVIRVDNEEIAVHAANRLLACGYGSFAYVGYQSGSNRNASDERCRAFTGFFRAKGLPVHVYRPDAEDGRADDTLDSLAKWLAGIEKPCGVMVFYDEDAQLVFDACRTAHIRIPQEVALIGVDNDMVICENMDPTLTSVLPDFEGAGYLAAGILDRAMRSETKQKPVTAKYGVKKIVERMTTQDTCKHGRLVSSAREFIRLHYAEGIRVSDVAAHSQASLRVLELRFRQILKHSIRDELLHVRLSHMKELLRTSNRPVGEIAYMCGFNSQSNAPMLFRKHTGMTMTAYRKAKYGKRQ